ncbi:MAG: HAD-IIB family hydrolase [Thomasclavelia sp.]|nr:HAD-IIB family hydrolase [Thomasclavelia sp.]
MDRKYMFFDIDGTLTDEKTKKIVPSALKAIRELEDNGHFVCIATGRAHYKAVNFAREIGVKNLVCSGGGALVVNDKLIYNEPLDNKKAKAIIKEAEDLGIGILLMLDDSIDVYSKNDLFVQQVGKRQEPTNYIYDENLDYDSLDKIYKIYLSISSKDEDKLTLKDTLGSLRYVKEYLMFQYDAKDIGIKRMIKEVGGEDKDVFVFGDDVNDLVMFKEEWTSIALGNAKQELKDKASYVTDLNINDGIYKACKKYKLI